MPASSRSICERCSKPLQIAHCIDVESGVRYPHRSDVGPVANDFACSNIPVKRSQGAKLHARENSRHSEAAVRLGRHNAARPPPPNGDHLRERCDFDLWLIAEHDERRAGCPRQCADGARERCAHSIRPASVVDCQVVRAQTPQMRADSELLGAQYDDDPPVGQAFGMPQGVPQ